MVLGMVFQAKARIVNEGQELEYYKQTAAEMVYFKKMCLDRNIMGARELIMKSHSVKISESEQPTLEFNVDQYVFSNRAYTVLISTDSEYKKITDFKVLASKTFRLINHGSFAEPKVEKVLDNPIKLECKY